ncbi:hypothetical protein [Algoriphagus confluentis]|uniref:DUF3575 domain-containing protein n=1 Tax=Algoriphagus confluentis TaxID=1697556 RepID=A0ABQ6PSX1_9BACT|nr:hypothetical protein Aconfl_29210 [Algoriphagus confluentis]
MKKVILALGMSLTCILGFEANAQTTSELKVLRWGIEYNVVWPYVPGVEIYTLRATRTLWTKENSHGDLTFGLLWRPGTDEDENAEEFSEFGINLGYRHYFWKGWHAELALYPSLASEKRNKIDGQDYEGFALTTEFYVGYKFDIIKRSTHNFYLMPQAGMGYNAVSNLGPETEANAPFPTLNLQVGINF